MKGLIYNVNNANQTTVANTPLDIGSIKRRYGCNYRQNESGIIILNPGYYDVHVGMVVTNGTTAALVPEFNITENGSNVAGAVASATIAANGVETLNIDTKVRVYHGSQSVIQVVPTIAGVTVTTLSLSVQEV